MTGTAKAAGRPRDAKLHAALLTATQDLLLEQGFDRLTMDSVAARAEVGKAAIYRRWPGKTALVVAAVTDLTQAPPVPDTGSLREDLLACGRTYIRNNRTQQILAGLMTAMIHQPELRSAAHDAIGAPFAALFHTVITRAIQRGHLPTTVDPESAITVFPAMAFHRAAALGLPTDDEFVVHTIDRLVLPLLHYR